MPQLIPYQIMLNSNFVGRTFELEKLARIDKAKRASILVVYGKRRIGKTELLEQAFRKRNVLKFEGIEGKPQSYQINQVILQFSKYLQDIFLSRLKLNSWIEVLELLAQYLSQGKWTLYFEELQWLSAYKSDFVTALKYVWDNKLRHNPNLLIILCGSSPSFMLNKIIHSKALYNRSAQEIFLQEFDLAETQLFFQKSKRTPSEIMDAYLAVGGVPEYLKYLDEESSVFLALCKHAFTPGGLLVTEYEKIFTSSLGKNQNYKKIIEFLSKQKFTTRNDLQKSLKISSGGTLSGLLIDLELSGFIVKYTPFNLNENSLLARYHILDQYLQFYFKFIKPLRRRIIDGEFKNNPTSALKYDSYRKWQGYAFERFCRKYHKLIAKILGFDAVSYRYGTFFNRNLNQRDQNFQIDLIYERKDKVYTICEIKYLDSQVNTQIIREFETKLHLFPNKQNYTLHKVLITINGATKDLLAKGYFDRIITLSDFFT